MAIMNYKQAKNTIAQTAKSIRKGRDKNLCQFSPVYGFTKSKGIIPLLTEIEKKEALRVYSFTTVDFFVPTKKDLEVLYDKCNKYFLHIINQINATRTNI